MSFLRIDIVSIVPDFALPDSLCICEVLQSEILKGNESSLTVVICNYG